MSDVPRPSAPDGAQEPGPATAGEVIERIDYELDEGLDLSFPAQLKALGDPLRLAIVDVVLERAMTVSELAERVGRPRGTVAYHVDLLVDAGLLKVVRTRRVRALEERFYGRTARTFYLPDTDDEALPFVRRALEEVDTTRPDLPASSTLRHARIPAERAQEYIDRLHALLLEFTHEPRAGDVEYGLMFHLFPTTRYRPAPARPPADPPEPPT